MLGMAAPIAVFGWRPADERLLRPLDRVAAWQMIKRIHI